MTFHRIQRINFYEAYMKYTLNSGSYEFQIQR